MEQPTIFENNFGSNTIRHRRHLLPLWAKIYCWVAMVSGLGLSIFIIYYINYIMEMYGISFSVNPTARIYFLLEHGATIVLGLVVFIVPLLLWLGKKWAIRINWILSGLFLLPIIIVLLLRSPSEMSSIVPIVLLLPIWVVQLLVQKKWETTDGKVLTNL